MDQLCTTVKPYQPCTRPSKTIKDPYNNGHCMTITTSGRKQTTPPPMMSVVEDQMRNYEGVVEIDGELVDKVAKEVKVPQKVVLIPRQPPQFPQRLVKKTGDDKYQSFITVLEQHSINAPLVEALEKMPAYAKFNKDMVTTKRSISFKDDDRMQHYSAISIRSFVQKNDDLLTFTIQYTIGLLHFAKILCALGASMNLMCLSFYKKFFWVT